MLGLSSCATVITEGAQRIWEDRSAEDQATDLGIAAGILGRLSERDAGLVLDLSTDVWEGRVLLTGVLDSVSEKAAVEKLVREDDQIRRLYSRIRIVTKAAKKNAALRRNQRIMPKRVAASVRLSTISGLRPRSRHSF